VNEDKEFIENVNRIVKKAIDAGGLHEDNVFISDDSDFIATSGCQTAN